MKHICIIWKKKWCHKQTPWKPTSGSPKNLQTPLRKNFTQLFITTTMLLNTLNDWWNSEPHTHSGQKMQLGIFCQLRIGPFQSGGKNRCHFQITLFIFLGTIQNSCLHYGQKSIWFPQSYFQLQYYWQVLQTCQQFSAPFKAVNSRHFQTYYIPRNGNTNETTIQNWFTLVYENWQFS